MQNGNYPGSHSSHMGPPSAHVSPYGQPSQQDPQPYSLPQLEKSHEAHSPAQFQQYSYDIQLRYPAPAPSFPAPSMAGRFEPPRDLPLPPLSNMAPSGGYGAPIEMDTTGQIPPPGVKPRVTATLWEDEGTLCFQVDVKGTCVARREGKSMCCPTSIYSPSEANTRLTDNHMINGTKLLNVVGMTRGRRDGILKSEKQKNVVKIGPMHLKGVWYAVTFPILKSTIHPSCLSIVYQPKLGSRSNEPSNSPTKKRSRSPSTQSSSTTSALSSTTPSTTQTPTTLPTSAFSPTQ